MATDISSQLTADQVSAISGGVARGRYNLLLGAGASLGSTGSSGIALPTGREFSSQLLHDFQVELDPGETYSLVDAFDLVQRKCRREGLDLGDYLKKRFTSCTVSWQWALTKLRWETIWTLNIDDVIERAFESSSLQKLKRYSWDDPSDYPRATPAVIALVSLHGSARNVTQFADNLVFSIVQYLSAVDAHRPWHTLFGDALKSKPFIVLGASLVEEIDLAELVRQENAADKLEGTPSLIVLKSIPPARRQQLADWGFIPIEAEASEFVAWLTSASVTERERFEPAFQGEAQAIRFGQQFRLLDDKALQERFEHDVFLGHDPTWSDFTGGKLATFESSHAAINLLMRRTQTIVCIAGGPGIGKTAALLTTAQLARARGAIPCLFSGEYKLDVDSALWYLSAQPNAVLLFDGLGDVSPEISKLYHECVDRKLQMRVLSTERVKRLSNVVGSIPERALPSENVVNVTHLTDNDIDGLIGILSSNHRLGVLTSATADERRAYFKSGAKRHLLAAMIGLEGAPNFRAKVIEEYRDPTLSQPARTLFALACFAYSSRYGLPVAIASRCTGLHPNEIVKMIGPGGQLFGILVEDYIGLRPQHKVFGRVIIGEGMSAEERFNASLSLVKSLAPYLNPNTISERTTPYRIARYLMDHEDVRARVGRSATQWYEELERDYSWNARYWDQRALCEARAGRYERARSYAEQAVSIQRHGFSLNTLGTILMKMAVDHHPVGTDASWEAFWAAEECLREAHDNFDDESPYPFTTFFTHTLRLARSLFKGSQIDTRVKSTWDEWMAKATRSRVFRTVELIEKLGNYRVEWLRLAVAVGP